MPELVCIAGPGTGQRYAVPNLCRIGRNRDNDVVLDQPVVSGHHAVIKHAGGRWRIEDGSKNGTEVNGRRIGASGISDGDEIVIVPFTFRFECGKPGPAPETADVSSEKNEEGTEAGEKGEDIPLVRKVIYGIAGAGLLVMLLFSAFSGGGQGAAGDRGDDFTIPVRTSSSPVESSHSGKVTNGKIKNEAEIRQETDAMFKLAESLYRDPSKQQNRYRAVLTWNEGIKRIEAEGRVPEYLQKHLKLRQTAVDEISREVQQRFVDAKVLVRQRNYHAASVLLREIMLIIPDQADPRHQQAARLVVKYRRF